MKKSNAKLISISALLFWLLLIFTLSAIPSLQVDSLGVWDLVFRKLAHFGEFAILAWLIASVLRFYRKINAKFVLSVLVFGLAYAASDEFHQLFVIGRKGYWVDWLIDSGGVLLGVVIYFVYQKYLQKSLDLKS